MKTDVFLCKLHIEIEKKCVILRGVIRKEKQRALPVEGAADRKENYYESSEH